MKHDTHTYLVIVIGSACFGASWGNIGAIIGGLIGLILSILIWKEIIK